MYPQSADSITAIVEFEVDVEQELTTGLKIAAKPWSIHAPWAACPASSTCYDTTLWPTVTAAEWKSPDRFQPAQAADSPFALRLALPSRRSASRWA